MHTIGRNPDGTWWVARVETYSDWDQFVYLFQKISFHSALKICSVLNGGGDVPIDPMTIRAWEGCAA